MERGAHIDRVVLDHERKSEYQRWLHEHDKDREDYDGTRFFRVIAGQWAQFGISGDPTIAKVCRTRTLPDEPRMTSNVSGTIAYAFKDPNGRTTQVFINLRDNSTTHDPEPFVPFGRVVEGMDVADRHAEYGERAGGGIRAGGQDALFTGRQRIPAA